MRISWQHLLLAFVLAVIAWYFVSGREMVESEIEVRLQRAGMNQNLVIRAPGLPSSVMVRVRGPKGLLQTLDVRSLYYSLDLSGLDPGPNVLPIADDEMPFPYTFEVMEIIPPLISVDVDRLLERDLPVQAVWNGTIADDYWLASAVTDPAFVRVRGPESVVSTLEAVKTNPLLLSNATEDLEQEVTLAPPAEVETLPGSVTATLDVAVRTEEWSPMVPVDVENVSDYEVVSVRPDKVRMHFEIPVPLTGQDGISEQIRARVVVGRMLGQGEHALAPQPELPGDSTFISFEPEAVTVTLGAERREERTYTVPVTLTNSSGRSVVSVTPDSVLAMVRLPVSLARNELTAGMVEALAVIDADAVAGEQVLVLEGIAPQGVEVLSLEPERITVQLGD